MAKFTNEEGGAINAAFNAIADLCECTNWSDAHSLAQALKLERAETKSALISRAMVCAAWAKGFDKPDVTARDLYYVRPGYLAAQLLGVRHQIERSTSDYTGPMVAKARELCTAAIDANNAHTSRIVKG